MSRNSNESVVVVLYNSGPMGFFNTYHVGPLSASITGSFANGTLFSVTVEATGGAVITADDRGIAGEWLGTGFSFFGTSLERPRPKYVVAIDAPEFGIFGKITLESVSPAHFPCGPNVPGANEKLLPNVFWSNAVPDAVASVDLSIGGSRLKFNKGIGYHDKNWGDDTFTTATTHWYWGHGRAGPYSLVFFDAFDATGKEYYSGYVTKDGKVLESSCKKNAVVARPWGENSDYPPLATTPAPQGLEVVFDLGDNRTLVANVTTGLVVIDAGVYVRAQGTIKATIEGRRGHRETYEGRVFWEEFKFAGFGGF